ncbi:unnamed protein product [Hymenolepis diminuta]|uniref:Uncharacterized protein n=1 Tax=Hymenolepis diminuta TaxID=6216 RepID=A0A564YTA4_HYMDI|nr:unnamed protein product [Hymenolepis diminuta]
MADGGENRSSDQLSRLKSRKILGVGNRNGSVSISKVGQILGNFSSLKRERDELAIWWLRTLAFILVLSAIISLGGVKSFREEINSILFDYCAFKLGTSLSLIYASFQSHEDAILVAIVLVLGVFSFSTIISLASVWCTSTGILQCGFNFAVLAISYLIFRGMMFWTPVRNIAL